MFTILQACSVLLLFSFAATFCKNRYIKIFMYAFGVMLFSCSFFYAYLFDSLIDYRFYTHLNFSDLLSVASEFRVDLVIIAGIITLSSVAVVFFQTRIASIPSRVRIFPVVFLLIFLTVPNGLFASLYETASIIIAAENRNFPEALEKIGIPAAEYVCPENVQATAGKNIIIIVMESAEQNFMRKEFANLTPNLNALSKSMTFYPNMKSGAGSTWTAGAIYTYLTGVPAFFKNKGNEAFQNMSNSQLTSLGTVLHKAGYTSKFIIGNPAFAGMDALLTANNFSIISEENAGQKVLPATWGLHDIDTFSIAKKEVIRLSQKQAPFCLGIMTVSTHPPDGIFDPRVKGLEKFSSQLEAMVAALDKHVGDFVSFLKENRLYNNTAIYILPDHPMMKVATASVIEKLEKHERKLMLFTNVASHKLPVKPEQELTPLDIPRLIIDGSGIKTNAIFLSDTIAEDKNQFVKKNIPNFVALNSAAVSYADTLTGDIKINRTSTGLAISSGVFSTELTIPEQLPPHSWVFLRVNRSRYVVETGILSVDRLNALRSKHPDAGFLLLKVLPNLLVGYLGKMHMDGTFHQGTELTFSKAEVDKAFSRPPLEYPELFKPELSPYKINAAQLRVYSLRSAGYYAKGNSYVAKGNKKDSTLLRRGLSLFHYDAEKLSYHTYDTHGSPADAQSFMKKINELASTKKYFFIVAHDSANSQLVPYKTELRNLGLKKLASLRFRDAYIGYMLDGQLTEHSSPVEVEVTIPTRDAL